ncbi:MAG TPA: hypothetical protein VIL99_16810 [Ignavibacteria bacterium]
MGEQHDKAYQRGYEDGKNGSLGSDLGKMATDLMMPKNEFDKSYEAGYEAGSRERKHSDNTPLKNPLKKSPGKEKTDSYIDYESGSYSSSDISGSESFWGYPYSVGIIIYVIIILINDRGPFFGKFVFGFLSGIFWPLIYIAGLIWGFDDTYSIASKTTLIILSIFIGAIIIFFIILQIKDFVQKKYNFRFINLKNYFKIYKKHKLIVRTFAVISICLFTFFFVKNQVGNRQMIWSFRNIRNCYSCSMSLEPERIYEIHWEEQNCEASELKLDGEYFYTLNYFNKPYRNDIKYVVKTYVNQFITNPMKIRVSKPVEFGIVFERYTQFGGEAFGELWGKWFRSWGDPIVTTHWSVKDITDSYNNDYILFDNNFHIINNRGK